MIGVDTNVVVRYLVRDDRAQAERAKRFFDDCRERDEHCFVGVVVLCELTWVLAACYDRSREEVVEALQLVLSASLFEVERKDLVRQAIEDFSERGGDFADHMIGAVSRDEGCTTTVTFDQGLKKSAAFTTL